MNRSSRFARWAWPSAALAAVLTVGALAAPQAFTRNSKEPLWTERAPAASAPSASPQWVEVARSMKPAVVNVSVRRAEGAGAGMAGPRVPRDLEDYFRRFFGERGPRAPREPHEARGLGSGFIINPNGHIVTNQHVVEDAAEVTVKLADGRELPATVIGRDAKTDLALLKVDATGLPTIAFGDSSRLQVGEPVMAIGNPFGLEQTVTTGIVSATGRVIGAGPYDDFIQTDASINPGNSGGPLLNGQGQVVGINTAIFSRSGGSEGIGFAIPVNLAKSVLTQLAEGGTVTRAWLGVSIQPMTDALAKGFGLGEGKGALVSTVSEGSPAAKAGVKPGDVIVEYDGRPIARADELPRAVAATPVGRTVTLRVMRDGKPLTLSAAVARLDEPGDAMPAGGKPSQHQLGLSVQTLGAAEARAMGLAEGGGVVVREVRPDGKAASAGIRSGDVIVEVDRKPVRTVAEFRERVEQHPAGRPVLVLVKREQAGLYLTIPMA